MNYQETGRFGRITKNLRKNGFQGQMESILFDSIGFSALNKREQTEYIEKLMNRMCCSIGQDCTDAVLHSCGEQCCGKSWKTFALNIWKNCDKTIFDFVSKLNVEEEIYNTSIEYDSAEQVLKVFRSRCICGLINKGNTFKSNGTFCNCSIGHMQAFFGEIFPIGKISLINSVMNKGEQCEWHIHLNVKS